MSSVPPSPKKCRKDSVVSTGGMSEYYAKHQGELVQKASMECEKVNNIFTPKLQCLLDKLTGWISVSLLDFACPIFSIVFFITSKAKVNILEKSIS